MTNYASSTNVSPEKSRAEIEAILQRFGATGFMYGWQDQSAMIAFQVSGRQVKFLLKLPLESDPKFNKTESGRIRNGGAQAKRKAWEQECRSKWRSLCLAIKAKLVSVEEEIEEFDEAFMAHIVLPDGQNVGEFMKPQIIMAYEKGEMPKLLMG